jgi:DNA-binding NarL/FixJ family response regulator
MRPGQIPPTGSRGLELIEADLTWSATMADRLEEGMPEVLRPGLLVVGEARDGNKAITEAKRLQPDVILLDLSMPVRTGLDALPEIRNVAPEAKVIVLSGFLASTTAPKVLEIGASLFIEKGANPEEIVAAIEEVMAKRLRVPLH